ncbi:hypothetical protein JYU14_03130 [Simkania negevensis]|uniref:Serine aminopeptidase S33 domain-containing protein n=1 Tax=Simkania negevensis TaxID=83561 RepID=A0ABS3AQQ7_9BACT|nr:hypothetical protein [Simkania negevensis]
MRKILKSVILALLLFSSVAWAAGEEITPYKYSEKLPIYEIPSSSRFTIFRHEVDTPDLVYYLTKPQNNQFPIVVLCEGSSDKSNVSSIIHFHRYFLQECLDVGAAVLTVEQWGIDGREVNAEEWIKHYTRSQRLEDHRLIVKHLLANPIEGWNGEFIFIGVSEGGAIVTLLSAEYAHVTTATVNWSGAGDWSWREELWGFLQNLILMNPECPHDIKLSECSSCLEMIGSRNNYDSLMDSMLANPNPNEFFLNMTHMYHADALSFPKPSYEKIIKPYLVVSGALDTIIDSSDLFVEKAKRADVPVTYLRVSDMDHYVRKRPDVIEASFAWLEQQITGS